MYHSIGKKSKMQLHFTKDRQFLCTKNREPSLKQINKQKEIYCFWIGSLNIVNILIFLKLIPYNSMQAKQTSQRLFKKLKSIIKCVWSSKRAGPPKTILKRRIKLENTQHLSYHEAVLAQYWPKFSMHVNLIKQSLETTNILNWYLTKTLR